MIRKGACGDPIYCGDPYMILGAVFFEDTPDPDIIVGTNATPLSVQLTAAQNSKDTLVGVETHG